MGIKIRIKLNFLTQFLRFFLLEVVIKSVLLCFIATFVVYLLLCITPKAEKKEVPIRYNETQSKLRSVDTTRKHYISQHTNTIRNQIEYKKFPYFYYIEWVKDILTGNFGRIMAGQSIAEEIKARFLLTFKLSLFSLIPALFISLIIGLLGNKRFVNWGGNFTYLLASLPAFLLGYLLFGIFGSNFWIAVITLGLSCGIINEIGRIIGNAMEVELSKDYIETARSKGLEEKSLPLLGTVGFHAFRNALITIIPRICLLFTLIISGSMVVEQVFRLPGLSYMLIDGLADKDIGRILIVVLLIVILVRIVSILTNFFYLLLNPRYGKR